MKIVKTITSKEAKNIMDGMCYIICVLHDVLDIPEDDILEVTRKNFVAYCEIEGIEAVELKKEE